MPGVIPVSAYGAHPKRPVGTMSVGALLVSREGVDDEVVRGVTREMFQNKVALVEGHSVAAALDETVEMSGIRFPLHDGAVAYYARDEPSFFVEYAEAMSFGFTIAAALISGFIALREWLRRRKKNRIDVYYQRIGELTYGLRDADAAGLEEASAALLALRRQAFGDLVAEKLEANESFTIFQDLLRSELESIRDRARLSEGTEA